MRWFLAAFPDAVVQAALATAERLARQSIPHAADLRWVPEDQRHITLHFLGEVDDVGCRQLEASLGDTLDGPSPTIELRRFAWMPSARRPRLLALAGDADANLAALHCQCGERIRRADLPIDGRSFHPHVTMARIRQRDRLASLPTLSLTCDPVRWRIGAVVLVESDLSGPSPRYTVRRRLSIV